MNTLDVSVASSFSDLDEASGAATSREHVIASVVGMEAPSTDVDLRRNAPVPHLEWTGVLLAHDLTAVSST